jgi:periplasmic copper chaperone A
MKITTPLFAFALCAPLLAAAVGTISVGDPHVGLVPPSADNAAVFMLLKNSGDTPRRLVKADSPAAKTVELHTVFTEGEVQKMRPVKDIPIAARSETLLRSGAFHVMLLGLKQPAVEGQVVPITLSFDDGSTQTLDAPVRRTIVAAHAR